MPFYLVSPPIEPGAIQAFVGMGNAAYRTREAAETALLAGEAALEEQEPGVYQRAPRWSVMEAENAREVMERLLGRPLPPGADVPEPPFEDGPEQ
jgi:hypothetical protein